MAPPESPDKQRFSDLFGFLRPLPVFLLVTAVSAMIYGLPGIQDYTETSTSLSGNTTTLILHLFLPLATGLLAALGVHLGRPSPNGNNKRPITEMSPFNGLGSEERSRSITRHIPLALVSLSREGKVIFRNPAAQSLFAPEGTDQDPLERFLEENRVRPLLTQVFSGGTITVDEAPCLTASSQETLILKITGVPLARRDRTVEALLILEDVTEIKGIEDELMRSEERYRNIFNHSASGIFFVDAAGNYLDANPAALKMLGYSLEELLKLNTRELSSESEGRLRRLKTTPGWTVEEARYLRKDGSVLEAELTASSFRSDNQTYYIGIVKNITRRKALERQLDASKRRFQALLHSLEEPILLFDREGVLAEMSGSAAGLLEMEQEALLATAFEDMAPEQGALKGLPEGVPVPLTLRLPGHRTLEVKATYHPLGPEGEIGSVLHIEKA